MQTLNGSVLAAVVNSDTNGESFLLTDTSLLLKKGDGRWSCGGFVSNIKQLVKNVSRTNLQFSHGETTTFADLGVVFNSLATDSRVQETINRAGRNAGSLLDSVLSASELTTGLIEPGLDAELPILSEMLVGQLVIVL